MAPLFSVPEHGTLPLASEQDTANIGAKLAEFAQTGDVICLRGALGAGKTTFARGFIQHISRTSEEIVSPTFTLVQTYESERGSIWHFDLYRIDDPNDVVELGLEDALAEGITLIEWPERLGPHAPPAPLEIEITSSADGTARQIRLSGKEKWHDRLKDFTRRVL